MSITNKDIPSPYPPTYNPVDSLAMWTPKFDPEVIGSLIPRILIVWGQEPLDMAVRSTLLKEGYTDYSKRLKDRPYRVVVFDSNEGTAMEKEVYGGAPTLVYNIAHVIEPATSSKTKMILPLQFIHQRQVYAFQYRRHRIAAKPVMINPPFKVPYELMERYEKDLVYLTASNSMSPLYVLIQGSRKLEFQQYENAFKSFVASLKSSVCCWCLSKDVPDAHNRHYFKCYELSFVPEENKQPVSVERGHWACKTCVRLHGVGTTNILCASPEHQHKTAMLSDETTQEKKNEMEYVSFTLTSPSPPQRHYKKKPTINTK